MKGFKDIDIMATDPMKEQFEPTEAQPIRQRARMAGDPLGGLRISPTGPPPQRLSKRHRGTKTKRPVRGRTSPSRVTGRRIY